MKKIIKTGGLIVLVPFVALLHSYTSPNNSYVLTNVKIECNTQCEATGSDQVYVTIPAESINHKTSATRSFKAGNIKAYTEIGANSGSASTAWFIKPGDKLQIFEKDLVDPDDLIKEIKITTAISNGQPQIVTGTNGSGKYKIHFTIIVI